MRRIILTAASLFLIVLSFSQWSSGGSPLSLALDMNKEVPTAVLPPLDMQKIAAEDVEDGKNGHIERSAVIRPINLNLYNSGVWTELENGDRIWRLVIHAEDALATTLLYEDFFLPEGAKLFIYKPDYSRVIGAFTSYNNHESGQFTTELIHGSSCVLEYFEPAAQAFRGSFTVSGVAHFYKNVPQEIITQDFGDSDNCEVNVNCSEGNAWQNEKKGVARIFVVSGFSGGWCTGSLVNNTNLDCTPYFLTAFHCGGSASASNLNNWVFYFNYEASGCSNPSNQSQVTNSPNYFSLTGCTTVSSSNDGGNNSSDFLLVEFNQAIPTSADVYYNGWDRSLLNTVSTNGVSIHHPAGDIKKISTYTQNLTTTSWGFSGLPSHYRVYWSSTANGHGVTEGGSSGSPIFNDQGLIIGTLTGGGSYCTATGQPDSYGKVSYHWNSNGTANNRRLDIHLDPAGNGSANSLTGSDSPCSATVALDASISAISEPINDICGVSFTPQVVLRNVGTNTLTSCQIRYQVTGSALQTYNWSGSLATNATTTISLNPMTASAGTNTFTAFTQSPNGGSDQNTSNDSQSQTFDAVQGGSLPIVQTFQANTFPPTNYDRFNGDGDVTWERTTSAGANSSASMFVDNWDYNSPGAFDWFILPPLDLTTVSNPTMTYDYAYAYYDGQQGTFYDSLIIAYSTDCGDTWFAITREGGTQLATAGGLSTEFTPTSSQWENVSLDLSAYASEDNITFAFVGVNGYGNNLYVDNINVQGGATTAPPSADFIASNTTICAGESVSFTNISTGTPTSYSWSFPGGNPSSSSQTNPVVTYNNPGTYTVTLTATNAGGSDTETKSNYIVVGSGPSLSLSSTPAACSGINNGTATVVASGGAGNYTYSWTGTSSTSATAINLAPGQYTVTVEDANGCNSSASVTVGANTDVSVQLQVTDNSASGGISSISSAVSGGVMPYTYLWSNGDITESITGIGPGNYTLTVTDANGCTGAASGSIAGVGIQELEWLAYVSLYPNPTSSNISLDIALIQEEDLSIQLLNPLGQIIFEEELIDFQSGLRQFDLKNLANGVYFVRISNQEASKLLRFVKKN